MPPVVQAVLLSRRDLSLHRQMAVAQPYAERKGYAGIQTVVYNDEDAVIYARMLAQRGFTAVILTVVAEPTDHRLASRLQDLGSWLECCRAAPRQPPPNPLPPVSDTEQLVIGMAKREITTGTISTVLKVPRSRVRQILDRFRPRT